MLEPEKQDGNIEYKLKLINKTDERIQQLATQMAFRCDEGNGECIYNLGVEDNGLMTGITDEEYMKTMNTLKKVANKNKYHIQKISSSDVENNRKIYEILVREQNDDDYIDIKVAIAGSVDAGKSSWIGYMTTGKKDNGRGSARTSVFNFSHELKSGRTSSIAHHVLGFDISGNIINYQGLGKSTWPEIIKTSSKVISFFDLAGHEKYLKTTILGLTSSFPDICFIMVAANRGILRMTKEHIFLCLSLKIPFVILITKVDLIKDKEKIFENTTKSINKILKNPGVRRMPIKINSVDDVIICCKNIYTESIVPIFHVSNVTGEGFDYVTKFLNLVNKRPEDSDKTDMVEYHIDNTFDVSGVPVVTGGQLVSGTIKIGDKLLLGPNNNTYKEIIIRSIHCKRVPVQSVNKGCYVCLGIKKISPSEVKKGNVIISKQSKPITAKKFMADISVLRAHSTTIKPGYEPILHACSIRQSVRLISIDNKKNIRNPSDTVDDCILRTGDRAQVVFEFRYKSEYLKPKTRILLCEGKCKVIGQVISILE
jgi:GTPase